MGMALKQARQLQKASEVELHQVDTQMGFMKSKSVVKKSAKWLLRGLDHLQSKRRGVSGRGKVFQGGRQGWRDNVKPDMTSGT